MQFYLLGVSFFTLLHKTDTHVKDSPRYRLLVALFGNETYKISRDVLPLPQNHTPIRVCFHFFVHQILEMNEKKQVMNLNIWLKTRWVNRYLTWDPKDFGGVESITVEKEKIWVPDIILWNRAVNDASMYKRMDTRILINHNGTCWWKSPVATSSTCKIQVKHFPFDHQNCSLHIGSWRHPSHDVTFSLCNTPCVSRQHYNENSEWTLRSAYGRVVEETFVGVGYSGITCGLVVSRKPMFYVMNMIVPCIIIALLSCLTFYLPANNGERTSLVITVLLSMTVYMLIVADSMPHTSDSIPLVQRFYLMTIIETALSLLASCIVIKWHENTAPMPNWVYKIFNCALRRLLKIQYVADRDLRDSLDNADALSQMVPIQKIAIRDNSLEEMVSDGAEFASTIRDVSCDGADVSQAGNARAPRDWRLAAKVLNQVFLIVFTLLSLVTVIVTFMGSVYI